jgi:FtsP/CotA-like multicopper oxidase with cupredoxin domain
MNIFYLLTLINCKIINKTLEISIGHSSPDGFSRESLLVNGEFGGPLIRLLKGDELYLTVKNRFNDSISIHLHGIVQAGTCQSDGYEELCEFHKY